MRDQRRRSGFGVGVRLALMLVGAWLIVAGPDAASAHAILLRSVPETNAELSQPPSTIDMWFSEPLEPGFSAARLLTSSGEEIPTGSVRLDPADSTHMTLSLGRLEPGIYTVAWQTLSRADGHAWYGSFPFTVLTPDGSRPAGTASAGGDRRLEKLPTAGETASRWLALLGGILLLGAPLLHRVIVPAGRREMRANPSLRHLSRDLALQAVWVGVLAIVLGSWLQAGLQAGELGGLDTLPDLLARTRAGALLLMRQIFAVTGLLVVLTFPQPGLLRGREWPLFALSMVYVAFLLVPLVLAAVQGEPAPAVVAFLVVGAGVAVTGWTPGETPEAGESRVWYGVLLLASAGLLTFSLGSHASAGPGSIWATLGDYLHLVAATTWVGGLGLLSVLIWRDRRVGNPASHDQLISAVRRFSYLASFALFVVILTGLFSSLVEVPSLTSLWETSYGRVLSIKLLLVALALGIALLNNRFVRRHAGRLQDVSGLRRFHRQVALEAAVSLGILLSVAILVQTTPPRPSEAEASGFWSDRPFSTITRADDLSIHVQVTPAQVGYNRFWVHLYHADGSSIGEVQLVRLFFNYYRETAVGQATLDLEPQGRNTFAAEGAYLNQVGEWDLSVYVRRRGMYDTLADVSLNILAPAEQDPWQSPVPGLPTGLIGAVGLLCLGVIPFVWRRPFQAAHPQLPSIARLMGGLLILGGLVSAIVSIPTLLAGANAAGEPIPATSKSIAAGARLYQERCASCHGTDGSGEGALAAGLAAPPADLRIHVPVHTDRELYNAIQYGTSGTAMPSFEGRLTHEEIWHLVNYLRDALGKS